ncbi:MAG TPA: ABC transporter ATP-binding protein [Stellaceae bacterium]|nr:ABC transporter ATP-binding protein [Stellaceae bacterium]
MGYVGRDDAPAGSTRPAPALELEGLEKQFGTMRAIDGVSLSIPPSSILALLGPSGCGKTTILRSIAGFVELDKGTIKLGGRDVTKLAPEQRGTAMVFQNYALFPHMTVADNVAFGLKMRRIGRAERARRVADALALVQLGPLAGRYPGELSGGQQQRTALARAVVTQPDLLLLDEPFGALDQNLREALQIELRKLQQRLGLATVIVTHDQQEAMILADQVAVMRAGTVEQLAPPAVVYDRPATRFVARFMGIDNILDGELDGDAVRLGPYRLSMPPGQRGVRGDRKATIAVRAEAIGLADPADGWPGQIAYATNLGGRVLYEVAVEGLGTLKVDVPRAPGYARRAVGEAVGVRLDHQSCTLLRD